MKRMITLAAALLVMATATSAQAQMSTVGLYNPGTANERIKGASGIALTGSSSIPGGTEVRVLVSIVSGYNYFRNHGVAG